MTASSGLMHLWPQRTVQASFHGRWGPFPVQADPAPLKIQFLRTCGQLLPISRHTPSSGQPLSPLPPRNPVLNVGSISHPLNLFIHSAIKKTVCPAQVKTNIPALLEGHSGNGESRNKINNICGVLAGGMKREGGQECWGTVWCVCARTHMHTRAQSLSRVQLFCSPMDCRPPGSSVHLIFQARILEWVVISSSGDLPNPGILTTEPPVMCWGGRDREE